MSEDQDVDPAITFDWTQFDSPSIAVITTVAEESGKDPIGLEPLYEVINPDSLDEMFSRTEYFHGSPAGRVVFEYHGYLVLVKATGHGHLYDTADNFQLSDVAVTECAQ